MSVHEGHRQRVRNRFRKEGLDNFEEHQVLELLLFYCIPRKDTNEIAHALLKRFGSVAAVLNASRAELIKVPDVGDSVADYFSLMKQLHRYYEVSASEDIILSTIDACGRYLVPRFADRRNETVFLVCLDAKCKVLDCCLVGEGSVNSAAVPIRRIVEMALSTNATSVILAHNHPSGLALPSEEDTVTTRKLAVALSAVEIELVDHIIVADKDFVSMTQSGMYHPDDWRLVL